MASGSFDMLAAEYDRNWTNSGPGRLQRNAVWREMIPLFRPGDSVLDLGCGTGEDAECLGLFDISVRALDASPEMVRMARARGVNAEVGKVEDIREIDSVFDGLISNFGPLNCVEDIRTLRTSLAQIVRPGGFLVLCLMSRFCLMESLHYFCRRQWRKAVRRWMGLTYAETLGVNVFYPSGQALKRALSPEFRLVRRIGIGLTVPPSYMTGLSPASLEMRDRFDECFAHWPVLRSMADHQLFVFVRK